jgi:hypothetical protein
MESVTPSNIGTNRMQTEAPITMTRMRLQMVLVAVLVCLFASGMSGMLNFFKYRANAERVVLDRLEVTGHGIESSIRASLALGMQFADIGTLPEKLSRELEQDELTRTIQVFDVHGQSLYSTDSLRGARGVHDAWRRAAENAGGSVWRIKDGVNSAVGIPVKTQFGLVLGHLALRYNDEDVQRPIAAVGRQIALNALLTFGIASLLTSLALIGIMWGISRDMATVERYLDQRQGSNGAPAPLRGPFAAPLKRFLESVRKVEKNIDVLRRQVARGDRP